MKKSTRYILATAWILVSRSFDAYATWQHTPDLQKEASPLASVFGLSWLPILLLLGAVCAYVMFAYYKALFGKYRIFPTEKGYSLSQFAGYMATGAKAPWWKMWVQFPKKAAHLHAYFGYLMVISLSVAGVFSTVMWVLIWTSEFYRSVHSAGLVYGGILVSVSVVYYWWVRRNYLGYVKA
ncbi:MAG: hypothetical protein IM638_17400 [Bacteroidetes bacterium]|nr:hypothetical protein [Bacteroidota bacterium]